MRGIFLLLDKRVKVYYTLTKNKEKRVGLLQRPPRNKEKIMLHLNREEILNLMVELPETHWLQNKLWAELTTLQNPAPQTPTYTPTPTTVPPVTGNIVNCLWEDYGYRCNALGTVNGYCRYHTTKTCAICGKKATHGCPVELQFICGTPLCADHRQCQHKGYGTC